MYQKKGKNKKGKALPPGPYFFRINEIHEGKFLK